MGRTSAETDALWEILAVTAPDVTSAPTTLHVAVNPAVQSDLELVLAGVRLPWSVLGGDLPSPVGIGGDPVADTLSLVLPLDVVGGADGADLVLTDPTSMPLARLGAVTVTRDATDTTTDAGSPVRATVAGTLTPWSASADALGAEWARPATTVIVAQRPLLEGELGAVLARPAPEPVRVLVPTGPTPDGIPGLVLLDAVRSAAAGHVAVEVVAVPLHWRAPAADALLVTALADRLSTPVTLFAATDVRWVAARAEVLDGRVPPDVDASGTEALTAWRPPVDRRGVVVFFTGFSGSGKSSIADALVEHVRTHTRRTITLLDGDVVRTMLSSGLGFDRAGRDLNIRRIGYVAAEIARHHGMAVCAPIAPFAETRAAVREMVEQVGDFVLVHVSTPLEECERRDRKGLYARARAGEIPDFTGISSPYEVPTDADLVVDTTGKILEQSLAEVLDLLRTTGWISA